MTNIICMLMPCLLQRLFLLVITFVVNARWFYVQINGNACWVLCEFNGNAVFQDFMRDDPDMDGKITKAEFKSYMMKNKK